MRRSDAVFGLGPGRRRSMQMPPPNLEPIRSLRHAVRLRMLPAHRVPNARRGVHDRLNVIALAALCAQRDPRRLQEYQR